MSEVLVAIFGGLIGGAISPIILEEYRRWTRERKWAAPRKARLLEMLAEKEWRTLSRLCLETGMNHDDCRTLLVELGARGGSIKVKGSYVEGWTMKFDAVPEDDEE